MVRSHKKARHSSSSSSGSSRKKKSAAAAAARTTRADRDTLADGATHVPGWTQRDYQRASQQQHQVGEPVSPAAPAPPQRSSRKKKRQQTPSWMIDPDHPPPGATQQEQSASSPHASSSIASSPIGDSSSWSSLSSSCWNSLPRDCLLHVFSFHDFFAITRMTNINHFWYRCIKRGLMTRIVEHSWKLLKCKKPTAALMQSVGSAEAGNIAQQGQMMMPLPSMSAIISPLFDDEDDVDMSVAPARNGLACGIASPALSSLPPSAALKSITTLHMTGPAFPVTTNTPGAPFSSSSTLFKASVVHLDSLYLGQKQLRYSLHSNPLFQNLWLTYHVSACQQRVIEEVRKIHVVVYRNSNGGKWPRSTKAEPTSAASKDSANAASSANEPPLQSAHTYDLMPHHIILDASLHHRDAFLSQLHAMQKHIWTFLHDQPQHVCYGFTGTSLPAVQLSDLLSRMEFKLVDHLRRQKLETKSRYAAKRPSAAASITHARRQATRDDDDDEESMPTAREDDAATYVSPIGSSSAPLLSSADAHQIHAIVRRMSDLTRLWGAYLHSDATGMIAAESAEKSASDFLFDVSPPVPSVSVSGVSSADRSWDDIGAGWSEQHRRLTQIERFWSCMAEEITVAEKAAAMKKIARQKHAETELGGAAAEPVANASETVTTSEATPLTLSGDKRKRADTFDQSEVSLCANAASVDPSSPFVPPAARLVGIELNPGPHGDGDSSSAPTVQPGARWRILKRALVKKPTDDATIQTPEAASVRRHAGFQVMRMETINGAELQEAVALYPHGANGGDAAVDVRRYQYVRYHLPAMSIGSSSSSPPPPPLLFRIRRPDSVSLSELSPAQQVDNTGNVCIWNSEEVLTAVALKIMQREEADPHSSGASEAPLQADGKTDQPLSHESTSSPPLLLPRLPRTHSSTADVSSTSPRPLRVLELGAGMSGLCGIALAHAQTQRAHTNMQPSQHTISEMVITDGNTACIEDGVAYQVAWNNAARTRRQLGAECESPAPWHHAPEVSSCVLQWDRNADYSHLGRFDMILAADCLFFRHYHPDFCHVLRSLLVPGTGRAFLLAPRRGGSLQAFVEATSSQTAQAADTHAQTVKLHVEVAERYDEDIWSQHQHFLSTAKADQESYSVDLHYPLLLTVRTAGT